MNKHMFDYAYSIFRCHTNFAMGSFYHRNMLEFWRFPVPNGIPLIAEFSGKEIYPIFRKFRTNNFRSILFSFRNFGSRCRNSTVVGFFGNFLRKVSFHLSFFRKSWNFWLSVKRFKFGLHCHAKKKIIRKLFSG